MSKRWHRNPQDPRNWTDRSSPVFNSSANPLSPAGRSAAKQRQARRRAKRERVIAPPAAQAPCEACGAENRPGAHFCRNCGQSRAHVALGGGDLPRRAGNRQADGARPSGRSRPRAGLALLALLVATLVVAGVAVLSSSGTLASNETGSGSSATARVVAGEAFIRGDPSTTHAPVGTVGGGRKVKVVCRVGPAGTGWYRLGGRHAGDYIGGSRLVEPPALRPC